MNFYHVVHVLQVWDDDLAASAKEYAEKCIFEHGFPDSAKNNKAKYPLGQNLYAKTGRSNLSGATGAWFNEKKSYDFEKGECREPGPCGHYTQVRTMPP